MTIKQQIETDLKTAMLAGDKVLVTTLRGLKSTILYAEVAAGSRDSGGLDDKTVVDLFRKEAKKRQESADLYVQGNSPERAANEMAEKEVIERYLPAQMSDDTLNAFVDTAIAEVGETGMQAMGKVIARVKELTKGEADGSRISAAVKGKLV